MPTDNVLIRINTIAGMAGIEKVQAGLLGLNVATLGLVAGLAILYKVGSDGIENFKKQEEVVKQLTQAYATQGMTYEANRTALEQFISTNARFISNQYDVMAAMAVLVRAGNSETDALRILNDALDRSAQTHEDVSTEAIRLERALQGNAKALKELGIFTEYQAIQNDKLLTTEQKHLAILTLIETRTRGGRQAVDEYTQSQNELNKSWQDFTGKTGGPLVSMLTAINKALSTGVQILDLYLQLMDKLHKLSRVTLTNPNTGTPGSVSLGGRASGGSVQAGTAYTVGEQGPETLVMGNQGGSILPNGGGRRGVTVNIDLRGAYIDPTGPQVDRLTTAIAQRLRMTTGI